MAEPACYIQCPFIATAIEAEKGIKARYGKKVFFLTILFFEVYLCGVMQNLYRNIGISYFMLLMLVKVLAVPVIALHYLTNKDYIAANLCENKSRPAMKCYGKCQLRKQLAKTSESSGSASNKLSQSTSIVDYCEPLATIAFKATPAQDVQFHTMQHSMATAGFTGNIFHPPIA